jgi:hypothetical protein
MLFLESPWPFLIVGLVIETLLAVALFRTGQGKLLGAMGGVALLVLLGVLFEQNWVTDTKLVRQTLEAAAAGLVAGSADRVDACIVSGEDGDAARDKTRWALGMATFHAISVRNLEVKFNLHTSPPTAETEFMAMVRGTARGGEAADLGEIDRPVQMKVKLRKQSGHWLIFGLPEHDVRD